ncbi:MAG TPA: serine/threonine-protein kinase [Pyrinomonadaceae bacterium]|nr:serine/threonine-protein kinase [Pyrinomonadaceae bacterium]
MDTPQIIAGRFRVEREIGRGGMGTVYRASHLGLERPVAIKILKQEFAALSEVAERFMREARTMARLRHQRAAMIFDAGHLADGRPFIVMEHVEGATLAEALAREGSFEPERAVRVASEICDVLSEAHALGIVHRDLKPSNIMLNDRGVCVLDFGIAKVLADSTEVTRTHATTESGLIIGTPRYMSPEQCLGHKVGPASDLYSVGVLLYEMLAGRPPFVDPLSAAVLVKQATAPPPPLLSLRPDCPRALASAVHALLAKNPAHRPASAAAARQELERTVVRAAPSAARGEAVEPFASTIGVINGGRFAFTRVATAFVIVAMLFTVLLMWAVGSGRASAREPYTAGLVPEAVGAAARLSPRALTRRPTPLTPERARGVAESLTRASLADVRLVRAREGQAIAALGDDPVDGMTSLFIIERRGSGGRFAVTERAPLDVEGFRGADWAAEAVDLDGDGYEEVLCTGRTPGDEAGDGRRYVVYAPRTRSVYSLHVAPDADGSSALRATWSPNTQGEQAKLFRHALRQRAFN